jgi:hypothetical protein
MAIVVEDGTGVDGAESYVTVAEFKAYAIANGLSGHDASDTDIEAALRRATRYIDNYYRPRWPGSRTYGRDQDLAWPRTDVLDGEGEEIPDDEIPDELKTAVYSVTSREIAAPGGMMPDITTDAAVIEETVGPITVKYAEGREPQPTYPAVDAILDPLLLPESDTTVAYFTRA